MIPQTSAGDRASARSLRYLRWLKPLVAGLAIAILLRALVAQVYFVSSGSMSPTLQTGDRILVWKWARWQPVERGEVAVLDGTDTLADANAQSAAWWQSLLLAEPLDQQLFVKRVIAIGGDRLQCCDAHGRLLLSGRPLTEPYLIGPASSVSFDVEVPTGRIFVLGDNRADSWDSLDLLGRPGGGMIGADRVVGRVADVLLPTDRIATVN